MCDHCKLHQILGFKETKNIWKSSVELNEYKTKGVIRLKYNLTMYLLLNPVLWFLTNINEY